MKTLSYKFEGHTQAQPLADQQHIPAHGYTHQTHEAVTANLFFFFTLLSDFGKNTMTNTSVSDCGELAYQNSSWIIGHASDRYS